MPICVVPLGHVLNTMLPQLNGECLCQWFDLWQLQPQNEKLHPMFRWWITRWVKSVGSDSIVRHMFSPRAEAVIYLLKYGKISCKIYSVLIGHNREVSIYSPLWPPPRQIFGRANISHFAQGQTLVVVTYNEQLSYEVVDWHWKTSQNDSVVIDIGHMWRGTLVTSTWGRRATICLWSTAGRFVKGGKFTFCKVECVQSIWTEKIHSIEQVDIGQSKI